MSEVSRSGGEGSFISVVTIAVVTISVVVISVWKMRTWLKLTGFMSAESSLILSMALRMVAQSSMNSATMRLEEHTDDKEDRDTHEQRGGGRAAE